jgi:hypothetical protein
MIDGIENGLWLRLERFIHGSVAAASQSKTSWSTPIRRQFSSYKSLIRGWQIRSW